MNPQLFQEIGDIFEVARSLSPDDRRRYLDSACASNPDVRAEVEALLEHHRKVTEGQEDSVLRQGLKLRQELLGSEESALEHAPEEALERIGRYRITGKIARGGMGSVLRADDERIGREVAVKVLLGAYADNDVARRRFVEEGQIGGQLQHPGIVPIHELGETDDHRPFLAMKLVEGRTLADLLRDGNGLVAERRRYLHVFEHSCQAMAYAHSRGVIHRDLKPLNIMVGAFGEVQVMDWGLAKVLEKLAEPEAATPEASGEQVASARSIRTLRDDSGEGLSLAGRVMGTPAYMAPEQARGESSAIDERVDVFGLGAILCEILTGAPPYVGETTAETVRRAREGDIGDAFRRIDSSNADPELIRICKRCLAVRPGDRYRSAGELSSDLSAYLQSVEERAQRALLEATEAKVRAEGERKARRLTTTFGLLFAVVLLGGFGVLLGIDRQRRARIRVAESHLRQGLVQAEKLRAEAQLGGAKDASKWEAALVAATRTRDLATVETDPSLRDDAARLVSVLEGEVRTVRFLSRLEAITLGASHLDTFDNAPAEAAYRDAFREFLGSDVLEMDPEEARDRLTASGFSTEISMSLDDWTLLARKRDPTSKTWNRIQDLASLVDPDPWRNELRKAAADRSEEALARLAASEEVDEAPARSLLLLAQYLLFEDRVELAVSILRRSRERFPDDFHTNYNLGLCLLTLGGSERVSEALCYFTAADALRPESALILGSLSACHVALGDPERARTLSKRALAITPNEPFALLNHGDSLRALGDLRGAEDAYSRARALFRENHAAYGDVALRLAHVLLRTGRPDRAASLYAESLGSLDAPSETLAFVLGDRVLGPQLLKATESLVTSTGRTDPEALSLLAAIQETLGLEADAIATLEEVVRLRPNRQEAQTRLERLRDTSAGRYATFASIDAIVDALGDDIDLAGSREWFRRFLEDPADTEAAPRRRYLEARLLQRASRPEEAIQLLREVLRAERGFPEPFVRLHESLVAFHGPSEARRLFRETLREAELPPTPLPVPPEQPKVLLPREGVAPASGVSILRSSPFEPIDPREAHVATRWMIRGVDGAFDRDPVLDVLSRGHLVELELPVGLLEAGGRYACRVAYVGSSGRVSDWSEEVPFSTPRPGPSPVPFDLSSVLNRDVIANPGDPIDDAFDDKNDFRLLVVGYGGILGSSRLPEETRSLQGLPRDRRIGVHRLGSYDGPNALQLGPSDEGDVRIDVPHGRYVCVRLLVSGSNGDSVVPISAEFSDGTVEERLVYCEDWFDDVSDGQVAPDGPSWPVWNGMDRMGRRLPESRSDPALFEVLLPLPADRELQAIVLHPARADYREDSSRFHLFAATAMKP